MSFVKSIPETSFAAIGAGRVWQRKLKRQIAATSAIVEAVEDVIMLDPGVQAPESSASVGRVWGIRFAGTGPTLSGGGESALAAIVAAHDGIDDVIVTPNAGGDNGKVWGWSGGSPGWVTPASGGGSISGTTGTNSGKIVCATGADGVVQVSPAAVTATGGATFQDDISLGSGKTIAGLDPTTAIRGALGAGINKVPRTNGAGGLTLQGSGLSVADDGTAIFSGTYANGSEFITFGNSDVTGPGSHFFAYAGSPIGVVNALSPSTDANVGIVVNASNQAEIWTYTGATAGNGHWNKVAGATTIFGFALSWGSITTMTLGAGNLVDAYGRYHATTASISLATTTLNAPGGSDSASLTASRWYYVYLIRNNSGVYSACFSLSDTAPNLIGTNFSSTGYVSIARVGHFRSLSTANNILEFYQCGKGLLRTYTHDDTGTTLRALSAGIAASLTVLGYTAGAGTLPIHAIRCIVSATTNATAGVSFAGNTATGSVRFASVPASTLTAVQRQIPFCSAGTFCYINSTSGGSTTIDVLSYDVEDLQ